MFSRRDLLAGAGGAAVFPMIATQRVWAQESLQGGSFRQGVVALLKSQHPGWAITLPDDPTMLDIDSKTFSLTNIYLHVRTMPQVQSEHEIMAFFENGMLPGNAPGDEAFSVAQANLRPQIIPDDYKQTASDIVARPFYVGLSVAYALDEDKRYQLLREPDLKAWAVARSEVETQAVANLENLSGAVTLSPRPNAEAGAFVTVDMSDGYDAARLLLPRFMARLRASLNVSSAFVGIPNRDFLVAWTPDFAARRGFAAKIAEDAQRRPHPLTDALFVSSDTGVRLAERSEMRDHGR